MSVSHAQQANPEFLVQTDDHITTVRLAGGLSGSGAVEIRDALLGQLRTPPQRVRVDLTRIHDLDTIGVGVLLVVALWARKYSAEFSLIPSETIRDQLTSARLDGYLTLVGHGSAR